MEDRFAVFHEVHEHLAHHVAVGIKFVHSMRPLALGVTVSFPSKTIWSRTTNSIERSQSKSPETKVVGIC